jgi:hypothetical protein
VSGWKNPEAPQDGGAKLRAVESFSGLRVTVLEGDGNTTVRRHVVYYFDEHGQLIAAFDPFPGGVPS